MSFRLVKENYFNMMIGFRHDSPVASAYGKLNKSENISGYAIKLAPESQRNESYVNESLIGEKSLPIVWLVSNCFPKSNRGSLVNELR